MRIENGVHNGIDVANKVVIFGADSNTENRQNSNGENLEYQARVFVIE